jgi:peptidoglycan lytic transglycosylase D
MLKWGILFSNFFKTIFKNLINKYSMKKTLKFLFMAVFFSFQVFAVRSSSAGYMSKKNAVFSDSASVYSSLEQSRVQYTKALISNAQADSKSSSEEFEAAVQLISRIDTDALDQHIQWKRDFNSLGVNLIQDYFRVVDNPPANSRVYSLARQLDIDDDSFRINSDSDNSAPVTALYGNHIPLVKNATVEEFIKFFQTTGRLTIDKWAYRTGKYFTLMRGILREYSAPEELVYLATIESGLNPQVSSWVGAKGLWQFMPSTGSMYGLYYDGNTDDKQDPEKATNAAARHLNDLYAELGDWYLALASYNAGIGRIKAAILKSGSRDFWVIRNYLPKETQDYVPKFIACALIMLDPKSYGFDNLDYASPLEYDRLIIKAEISISRVAELAGTNVETIRELNPQLLQDTIPVFADGYLIKIPIGLYSTFIQNYDMAMDFNKYSFEPTYEGNERYSSIVEASFFNIPQTSTSDIRI